MDTTDQRKITLRQGKLMVFTRAASPFFQCRIKLPAELYVYKSLQTTDEAEARQMAEDLSANAKFKAHTGMSIRRRAFRNVAGGYPARLRFQVEGDQSRAVFAKTGAGGIDEGLNARASRLSPETVNGPVGIRNGNLNG
jgi:hypothetical protein